MSRFRDTARDADRLRNLTGALRQVLDPGARGRSVTITLNGCILAARSATNIHASNVVAFGAVHYGQLGEIDAEGITVVLTSRVPAGRLYLAYGDEGGGSSMKQLGVVFASDLSPWKARILLMLTLPLIDNPDRLQLFFDG